MSIGRKVVVAVLEFFAKFSLKLLGCHCTFTLPVAAAAAVLVVTGVV